MDEYGAGTGSVVFTRSMARQGAEIGCAGIGGVLFLAAGLLGIAGVLGADLTTRLMAGGMFSFFGIFMLVSVASAMGRGADPRVAEISPSGAWLPEMGFLPWTEIAEVRLERIRGVGGSDSASTKLFRRLGFVPLDPSKRASASTSAAWGMAALYMKLVKALQPGIRMGGDDPAPFGVTETEIPTDFERLIETVGRHASIGDAAEARAREHAPRWSSSPGGVSPDLAALDAAIAAPPAGRAPSSAASLVPARPPAEPAASFRVPAIKPVEVVFAVLPVFAPLTFVLPVLLPQIQGGGVPSLMGAGFLLFVGAAFVVPGLVVLIRLVRRARERGADVARLRVGPDGIWTPAGGLVAWPDVRAIRTERAGWARQLGTPSIERWRLVVEPSAVGSPAGTALSDELDAPFDDVLDLVRVYHPVTETT